MKTTAMLDNLKETPGQAAGWFGRARRFLTEVRAELGRVTWPTRREVYATTVVVILVSIMFGMYLWGVDLILSALVRRLFLWMGAA
jgi:preprotein translocase subunit SecE